MIEKQQYFIYYIKIECFYNIFILMKIWDKTIEYLTGIVTWDSNKTVYKSWPQLVLYFNKLWFKDQYLPNFPSRAIYCMERIISLNNENKIELLIENYYNPINFIENELVYDILIGEINKYLYFDDLILVRKWKKVKLEERLEENESEDNNSKDNNSKDNILIDNQINLIIPNEMYSHIKEYLKNEDYFHAVEESYKFVREKLRDLTWEEKATDAFRDINQEKIFWHKPVNDVEKDFFDGVKYLHMWIQFLRNQKSHSLAEKMNKNLALHYISLASLAYQLITHEI